MRKSQFACRGALGRNNAFVNIQVVTWQANAPTGLNGWIGFQNEAIRKCPNVPNDFAFPRVQPVPIECQNRPQPAGREVNRGPHQEVLHRS